MDATCAAWKSSGVGSVTFNFQAGSSVDLTPGDGTGAPADVEISIGSASVLDGALTKSGTGMLKLAGIPASCSSPKIHVKDGTLAFRTSSMRWKHWKFVFCEIEPKNGEAKGISVGEVAVYDADGKRLNVTGTDTMARLTSETSFSAERNSQMYDGIAADNNWGFLGSVPDPSNESSWAYTSFALSDAAPPVAAYNLMSGGGGTWNCWPKTWKVYARETETDEWILVDTQTNATLPNNNFTWYNGGNPWLVTSTQASGEAAFPASTPVAVDPGATLDLSDASATAVSSLVVDADAVGYGTITGGVCAASGVIRVTVADKLPSGTVILPLKFAECADTENVRRWTLEVNGAVKANWHPRVAQDGTLTLESPGCVIVIR